MLVYENKKIKKGSITTEIEIPLMSGKTVKKKIEQEYKDVDSKTKYFLIDEKIKHTLEKTFRLTDIECVMETVLLDDIISCSNASYEKFDLEYKLTNHCVLYKVYKNFKTVFDKNKRVFKEVTNYEYTYFVPYRHNYSEVLIKPLLSKEFKNNVADALNIYCFDSEISIYLKSKSVKRTLLDGSEVEVGIRINLDELMFNGKDVVLEIVQRNLGQFAQETYEFNMSFKDMEKALIEEVEEFLNKLHANVKQG